MVLWFYRWFLNPLLVWLLRSPLHWLASGRHMLITYTGRRTGLRITIPVWYRTSGSEITVTVGPALAETMVEEPDHRVAG